MQIDYTDKFKEGDVRKGDLVVEFACGCFIVNRKATEYRTYQRVVCAHHRFFAIKESEEEQRSQNFVMLADAFDNGVVQGYIESH